MKYRHSSAQSADYLRLALKQMTKQKAGLHPASYAIWYEYVANLNPALQAAIDTRLGDEGPLDDEATYALYDRYLAELDSKTALRIGDSVSQIVGQVSDSAAEAVDQASRYGSSLERWTDTLLRPVDSPGPLAAGVEDILRGTREMQGAISRLQEQLEESTREAQQLRQEVARAREEALIDALTGLANRKSFDLALAACLAEAQPDLSGPCLLMIDLDNFKRINDAHGTRLRRPGPGQGRTDPQGQRQGQGHGGALRRRRVRGDPADNTARRRHWPGRGPARAGLRQPGAAQWRQGSADRQHVRLDRCRRLPRRRIRQRIRGPRGPCAVHRQNAGTQSGHPCTAPTACSKPLRPQPTSAAGAEAKPAGMPW
jgi:hypothetical protein